MKKLLMLAFMAATLNAQSFSVINVRDSISGNDTASYWFGNKFMYAGLTLHDSTGASAKVDSVIVEFYSTAQNSWSSTLLGLYDTYNDNVLTSNAVVVPGNNTQRMYMINQPRPYAVRVRWVYGADKSGRVHYIVFHGFN